MKRGRKDQLTGGTGDVNPQEFVFPILGPALGVASAWTPIVGTTFNGFAVQTVLEMPISRLPQREGRVTVIEALWAQFYLLAMEMPAAASVQARYMNVTTNPAPLTDVSAAGSGPRDPRTIADYNKLTYWASAVGFTDIEAYEEIDLTDNNGHGLLVASDRLYANFVSGSTLAAGNFNGNDAGVVRLGYRFKDVTLTEYIGIVQSQQ